MDPMESRMTALEQWAKSQGHRLDRLEEQQQVIHSLAASLQVMAAEQKHQTEALNTVRESVTRLDGKVDALETRPARRWESLADKALWAVVGAGIAALLTQIGL